MRFDAVGLAVFQINAAAIGFVSGRSGREMFVYISEALVIRFAVLVLLSVGIGIAAMPDVGDELFAFGIGAQFLPGVQLIGRKDRLNVSNPVGESLIRLLLNLTRLRLRIGIWSRLLSESLRDEKYQRQQDRDSNRIASKHRRVLLFGKVSRANYGWGNSGSKTKPALDSCLIE